MSDATLTPASKWIGNAVIVLAGGIMLIGAAIAVAIIVAYVTGVVLLRKLKPGTPRAQLTAGM